MKRRAMDSHQDDEEQQPHHYKIYVKVMKTVALDVKCSDTVDQIKSKIGAIEGIDKNQQTLFFAGNHLENDSMLSDYSIPANASVDLYVTDGMQISVSIPSAGKMIKLNVRKSQSVADVKAAIKEKGGIPVDEQMLMHAGRQLEDHQMLSQCGLSNGQTLHVLVYPNAKLLISVDVYGERTRNLDVQSWYTVADVKFLIESLEGLPAGKNILGRTQLGGVVALEDTETLQNLNVRNNDILVLYQNVQFFIRTCEGKNLTMSMKTCDTIDEVTKKIEERLHLKEGVFYLRYEGRVLCLRNTLQMYKIEARTEITRETAKTSSQLRYSDNPSVFGQNLHAPECGDFISKLQSHTCAAAVQNSAQA